MILNCRLEFTTTFLNFCYRTICRHQSKVFSVQKIFMKELKIDSFFCFLFHKGDCGYIRYVAKVVFDTSMWADWKFEEPFTVIRPIDLNNTPSLRVIYLNLVYYLVFSNDGCIRRIQLLSKYRNEFIHII